MVTAKSWISNLNMTFKTLGAGDERLGAGVRNGFLISIQAVSFDI